MAFGATGEYPHVLLRSRDRDRLIRLHSVRITREEAVTLAQWLAERFPLGMPLRVFFAGRRGRSRIVESVVDGVLSRRIALPATDDLRIGIVLHEYAHQLATDAHGPQFVEKLDALAEAVSKPEEETPVAANAAGIDFREYTKRRRCHWCGLNTTRKHTRVAIACCGRCEQAHP